MVRLILSLALVLAVVLSPVIAPAAAAEKASIKMETRDFGKLPGKDVDVPEYVFTNSHGMAVGIIPYGGIITRLVVPDRDGKLDDVALGFDNLKSYLDGHPFFGCITGRYAGRIAKGKFTLDGKEYTLYRAEGQAHTLHGGKEGFDKKLWTVESKGAEGDKAWLKLKHVSPDGEEGFPGTLTIFVTYTVTDDNELRIDYDAQTDKKTVLNLTNHAYFNLRGMKNDGDVLDHVMTMMAKKYTAADDTLIATGEIKDVAGTPYDFTKPEKIGARIKELKNEPNGYDINYVLDNGGKLALATRVEEPMTGRVMEVYTTEPGMQFYTGNFLDGKLKGKGVTYKQHTGFCLEAQHFADSPNKPEFPSTELKPSEKYHQTTVYKFSTK
jgi:aldose 1-epimerase